MSDQTAGRKTETKRSGLDVIDLEVDKDGSTVTLEAGSWFVCSCPGSSSSGGTRS